MAEKPAASTGQVELRYTYCHLLHAGIVDHELGWAAEELARHGARLRYFLSTPAPDFYPHYTHGLDSLFRFGGCIPAIHVKADLVDTLLLGRPVVLGGRRDARARGRRHPRAWRTSPAGGSASPGASTPPRSTTAGSRRSAASSSCSGCTACAATTSGIVDCPFSDDWYEGPGMAEPVPDLLDFWRVYGVQADLLQRPLQPELEAGVIDACFVTDPFGLEYADSESVRLVGSLARQPDRTLQVGGAPYALTCTRRFADEHPELVTAYLRGLVRTGRWCNAERRAMAALLEATGFFPPAATMLPAVELLDFVPNLSAVESERRSTADAGVDARPRPHTSRLRRRRLGGAASSSRRRSAELDEGA